MYLEVRNNYSEEVITLSILVIIQDKKKSEQLQSCPLLARRVLLIPWPFVLLSIFLGFRGLKKKKKARALLLKGAGRKEKSHY